MAQNKSHAVMATCVSPKQAAERGLRWYFTGVPCIHGHISKRNLSNGECRKCIDVRKSLRRSKNPKPSRAADRKYHANNVLKRRDQARMSRQRHIDRRREEDRARYHNDPSKTKAAAVRWAKANKGKRAAIIAARRKWVKLATPRWLSKLQRQEIRAFYIAAAAREGDWHVDHIVPLRGKTVCGLNVPWNLRVITAVENILKNNRWSDDLNTSCQAQMERDSDYEVVE